MAPLSHVLAWLALVLPFAAVLAAFVLLLVRWSRLRRAADPESLLLTAVSGSLRERGELAASLGELRTVHERILDALPTGLLWVDQRQRVAALNRHGRDLLGVTPGVAGLEAGFVLEPFPWLREALLQDPGPPLRLEAGGRRWRVQRIEAPDRVGALLQFEDITEAEQEERRRQLRERFAELGEMTAGVAHQLKNGLAVLKGQGQLLQREGHGAAEVLLEETADLERLVQRFLQWAKPLESAAEPLRLEEAAAQVVAEMKRRPVSQGRQLLVQGEGGAVGDPVLLHQALVNLLENACQATPVGGRITVAVAEGRLDILDEGAGLGEETAVRMLRPFESGRPDGTGLGLPLALKWLNAQGADLRLAPRPEGGTRAEIRW
ncbi:PAS domain-containing sensor histidine kinase [Geothrix sp. 21YS21S-4]|uniref:sensor histidine kinase n=1 Tax=Geothrix sp. 21YS21S-4 TaxID=3068889 RepID=UPI0027BA453F|nr:ATP-binding protein [Geothrix sp. 21YS21S-4]